MSLQKQRGHAQLGWGSVDQITFDLRNSRSNESSRYIRNRIKSGRVITRLHSVYLHLRSSLTFCPGLRSFLGCLSGSFLISALLPFSSPLPPSPLSTFLFTTSTFSFILSDAMAESVEHWSLVREIAGSNPGRVKPMTYKIDTCRFLARCSALLG